MMYLGGSQALELRPEVARSTWLHVSEQDHFSGDTQQEETLAVDRALRELRNHGYTIPRESCQVLHVRELRHNPASADEVQKSKIFLVIASPHILVSVSDDNTLSIPHCKRRFAERRDVSSFELAAGIIKEALRPVRGVRMAFSRLIERLEQSHLQAAHQATRAALVRLGGALGVEVTAFQKIESLISDVRNAHRETLSRKLIKETEKSNGIQKEAEKRKQRADTQWQILGGISVPLGLVLGAIQAFQLSQDMGVLVLALSSVVAAGLVYFRDDWFGWLYGSRSSKAES